MDTAIETSAFAAPDVLGELSTDYLVRRVRKELDSFCCRYRICGRGLLSAKNSLWRDFCTYHAVGVHTGDRQREPEDQAVDEPPSVSRDLYATRVSLSTQTWTNPSASRLTKSPTSFPSSFATSKLR